MRYLPPGLPAPPLPAHTANTYRPPIGTLQQTPPVPPPAQTPPETTPPPQDDPHRALLTTWQRHHGSNWVRADELHPTVRRLIDPRERPDAIRQRLRILTATCPELEAKRGGTPTLPVKLYRLAPP